MIARGKTTAKNRKKYAILRADGSPQIGMGHIMRCIALAQGLRGQGIEPVFVLKNPDPSVTRTITGYHFPSELIPAGSGPEEDASITLETARRYGTRLVFTDLGYLITSPDPGVYSRYHQILKNREMFVVTLDVLYTGTLASDLVINPYYSDHGYPGRSSPEQSLNGPGYFLFRTEFIALHEKVKDIRQDVTRILVSFGGSDLKNTTAMTVRALGSSELQPLQVRVVLGPGYPAEHIPGLTGAAGSSPHEFEILQSGTNMAELLAWADLAILGGGLTKYEAAMVGTPSLVITQFAPEIPPNVEFAAAGTMQYLGYLDNIKENDIRDAVTRISADYPARVAMSRKGKALVDGNGVQRICAKIPKEVFL